MIYPNEKKIDEEGKKEKERLEKYFSARITYRIFIINKKLTEKKKSKYVYCIYEKL